MYRAEADNEMVLVGKDSLLDGVGVVVVGFNELNFGSCCSNLSFQRFRCSIVENVELWVMRADCRAC